MKRLEATGINIAVLDTGEMRVVITDAETVTAVDAGYVVYSPRDMYHYVQLAERERKLLHDFKKRFGGLIEWRAVDERKPSR